MHNVDVVLHNSPLQNQSVLYDFMYLFRLARKFHGNKVGVAPRLQGFIEHTRGRAGHKDIVGAVFQQRKNIGGVAPAILAVKVGV